MDIWGVHWGGFIGGFFWGAGTGQQPVGWLSFSFGWKYSSKAFLVLENHALGFTLG